LPRNLPCVRSRLPVRAAFLRQVLTDVIHICDSKLTYYPGSFRDFQRLRPEIAAGLPSPANAVQKAKTELAAPAAATEAASAQPPSSNGAAAEVRAGGCFSARSPAEPRRALTRAPQAQSPSLVNEPAIKSIEPLKFPDPGPLDGIRSRVKTVMKMVNVSFKYETASAPILTDATVRLTLGSRVALVGLNGAGALRAS
jgi:elongation factor 3